MYGKPNHLDQLTVITVVPSLLNSMHTVTSFNPQIPPSSTSLSPLSSLDHPVSSITIDRRYKGLRVAKDRRQTRKVRTKQIQCMSFAVKHPAMRLIDLMGCRPGDINRRSP
jgi:hypothetical protein